MCVKNIKDGFSFHEKHKQYKLSLMFEDLTGIKVCFDPSLRMKSLNVSILDRTKFGHLAIKDMLRVLGQTLFRF